MLKKLNTLVALLILSAEDDVPFPYDKLIGPWESVRPGQRIEITYTNPWRIETGYLFTLPGLYADDIFKGGIIQIPASSENEDKQTWILLKHAAIFANTLEVEYTL
jgi:hypothetical protein